MRSSRSRLRSRLGAPTLRSAPVRRTVVEHEHDGVVGLITRSARLHRSTSPGTGVDEIAALVIDRELPPTEFSVDAADG